MPEFVGLSYWISFFYLKICCETRENTRLGDRGESCKEFSFFCIIKRNCVYHSCCMSTFLRTHYYYQKCKFWLDFFPWTSKVDLVSKWIGILEQVGSWCIHKSLYLFVSEIAVVGGVKAGFSAGLLKLCKVQSNKYSLYRLACT